MLYPNNQKMKVTVDEAIKMARNNASLKGVVIEDLKNTQVRAVDALVLAEHGILIPESNIFYQDGDIAYDPDFDEMQWEKQPLKLTWVEKVQLAEEMALDATEKEEVSVKIKIPDSEIRRWVNKNYDKIEQRLAAFVVDMYKASKAIKD